MSSSRTPGVPALLSASLVIAVSGLAAGGSASVVIAATLGPQSSSPKHSEIVARLKYIHALFLYSELSSFAKKILYS